MAIFEKMDQILAPKGISMTIAPLGAVCAVLFTAPSSSAARVLHSPSFLPFRLFASVLFSKTLADAKQE